MADPGLIVTGLSSVWGAHAAMGGAAYGAGRAAYGAGRAPLGAGRSAYGAAKNFLFGSDDERVVDGTPQDEVMKQLEKYRQPNTK